MCAGSYVNLQQSPGSDCMDEQDDLSPVVQSIVSLTSLLVVKMLAVLVSAISNSQLFLLKKFE